MLILLLMLVLVCVGSSIVLAAHLFVPLCVIAVLLFLVAAIHRSFCYAPERHWWHRGWPHRRRS